MLLFLTTVLPFLAHDHPSAAAFLTCRHHNFHASIIPEFLSDEERVKSFCEARPNNQLAADWNEGIIKNNSYKNLYNLFVQTPLMQFSPSLIVFHKDCVESILKPLLETKYFTRSLQRCSFLRHRNVVSQTSQRLSNQFVQAISKIRSLTELDSGENLLVVNQQLEIIINSFPGLETLTIENAKYLDSTVHSISSPPPPATKTLRSLRFGDVDASFVAKFVPHFPNLRKLELSAKTGFRLQIVGPVSHQELNLLPLSLSLPLLTALDLKEFVLKNTESLINCRHLSTLQFRRCEISDLSFLTEENSLPQLTNLLLDSCEQLSTSSFASLSHALNLHVLEVSQSDFDNDRLQYLENMVHLRKLNLSFCSIVGEGRSLKTLVQNSFQLEELNLCGCRIGGQGVIAGALFSTHSKLRVLNLWNCKLVDDDLNGIGALKNTLEVLDFKMNKKLTNKALVHCRELVKLKKLDFCECDGIADLSPLKDCSNLEELDVSLCNGLCNNSFRIFSEDPHSFPKLQMLIMSHCRGLSAKVLEHLSKNNNLVYQLKELNVGGPYVNQSSPIARNNLSLLKGLRRLEGIVDYSLKTELLRSLTNLDEIF